MTKPLMSKENGGAQSATDPSPADFPLGSRQSRAAARFRLQRIALDGEQCICFPGPAPPFLIYPALEAIAFKIKCPLHGDRFQLCPHPFIPDWRREREIQKGWPRHSEQYLKAWNASFPRDSWTVQEVVVAGRCWLLPKEIPETQEIVRLVATNTTATSVPILSARRSSKHL